MKKTIFFDRDGTLIVDRVYLNDPEQITFLPGTFEALKLLKGAGFQFVMVTNQSGVARGLVTLENLAEIHRRMDAEMARHGLRFEKIYFSPHAADSGHAWRKPNPGMLLAAHDELGGVDFARSWMIGDNESDIEAGRRAGCRTVLLGDAEISVKPTVRAPDLVTAANEIVRRDQNS